MKRNRIAIFVTILSMLSLAGCMDVGDLTEQQSDLIAEYSAGVLLRYSDRYERRLITKEQLKKQERQNGESASASPTATIQVTPTPTPEATAGSSSDGQPTEVGVPNIGVSEFFQFDGVTVSYHSYKFVKKYGSAQIRAGDGETLCIVSFMLHNTSNKVKKLNLMKKTDISYTLDVDGSEYQPGPSILENGGLNQLITTLKPGKKEEAVLIYRMSKEKKNASSITLTIANQAKQSKITLR